MCNHPKHKKNVGLDLDEIIILVSPITNSPVQMIEVYEQKDNPTNNFPNRQNVSNCLSILL